MEHEEPKEHQTRERVIWVQNQGAGAVNVGGVKEGCDGDDLIKHIKEQCHIKYDEADLFLDLPAGAGIDPKIGAYLTEGTCGLDPKKKLDATFFGLLGDRTIEVRVKTGAALPDQLPQSEEEWRAWWQLLGRAALKKSVLRLPGSGTFPGTNRPAIYVRPCYRKLRALVVKQHNELVGRGSLDRPHYAVIGTPGIGKSLFAFYMLWWLGAVHKQAIIYENAELRSARQFVLIRAEGDDWVVHVYSASVRDAATRWPECWYIVDGVSPVVLQLTTTILVTYPDESIWKYWHKQATMCGSLFMPLWTDEELAECHKRIADVDTRLPASAQYVWGGPVPETRAELFGNVPRLVFGTEPKVR
eukprot:m51a1_g8665 hypothetical protein (358) ;mRNA; f:96444-97820